MLFTGLAHHLVATVHGQAVLMSSTSPYTLQKALESPFGREGKYSDYYFIGELCKSMRQAHPYLVSDLICCINLAIRSFFFSPAWAMKVSLLNSGDGQAMVCSVLPWVMRRRGEGWDN